MSHYLGWSVGDKCSNDMINDNRVNLYTLCSAVRPSAGKIWTVLSQRQTWQSIAWMSCINAILYILKYVDKALRVCN